MILAHLSFWLFVAVLGIALVHWAALLLFLSKISRKEWREPSQVYRPRALVILALRGGDPFLRRCLEGLFSQDYDNYSVCVVVDHPDDPSLPTVRDVITRRDPAVGPKEIDVVIAQRYRDTCALKCNSLLEAVERMDETAEVIVTLDADTNPYPTWLAELVEPLSDDRFVAASGMRWYFPPKPNAGTLVRYLWNAAAFVQMYFYKIPWGGSLAVKRELFTEYGLGERWGNSCADDVSIVSVVRQSGKRIAYVTSVLMANRETCRLAAFLPWVRRQILSAKLYHPFWPAVLAQCLLISLPQILIVGLIIVSALASRWTVFLRLSGTFAFYWLAVLGALYPMERAVRNIIRRTGTLPPKPDFRVIAATLLAVPLTQAVYTMAVLSLFTLKEFHWRGVAYRLLPQGRIRLIEYKPYSDDNAVFDATDSI